MEVKKNMGLIALLTIIGVIALTILVLIINGNIISKSDDDTTIQKNKYTGDNSEVIELTEEEQQLIDATIIKTISWEKPSYSSAGGANVNSIGMDIELDLECQNTKIAGIRLSGYCLDKDNNNYKMSAPTAVPLFNCNTKQTLIMQQYGDVHNSNGEIIPTGNIDWHNIEIKYCQVNKVEYVLSNHATLKNTREINYEKQY